MFPLISIGWHRLSRVLLDERTVQKRRYVCDSLDGKASDRMISRGQCDVSSRWHYSHLDDLSIDYRGLDSRRHRFSVFGDEPEENASDVIFTSSWSRRRFTSIDEKMRATRSVSKTGVNDLAENWKIDAARERVDRTRSDQLHSSMHFHCVLSRNLWERSTRTWRNRYPVPTIQNLLDQRTEQIEDRRSQVIFAGVSTILSLYTDVVRTNVPTEGTRLVRTWILPLQPSHRLRISERHVSTQEGSHSVVFFVCQCVHRSINVKRVHWQNAFGRSEFRHSREHLTERGLSIIIGPSSVIDLSSSEAMAFIDRTRTGCGTSNAPENVLYMVLHVDRLRDVEILTDSCEKKRRISMENKWQTTLSRIINSTTSAVLLFCNKTERHTWKSDELCTPEEFYLDSVLSNGSASRGITSNPPSI